MCYAKTRLSVSNSIIRQRFLSYGSFAVPLVGALQFAVVTYWYLFRSTTINRRT